MVSRSLPSAGRGKRCEGATVSDGGCRAESRVCLGLCAIFSFRFLRFLPPVLAGLWPRLNEHIEEVMS